MIVAWVESPLQAVNAIEWAQQAQQPCRVLLRADVPSLAPLRARLEERLAHGPTPVELAVAPDPVRGGLPRARRRVLGDVFSGQIRLVTALMGARDAVIVDDGSATLHLARVLGRAAPYGRMGQRESLVARALGAAARARLLRAARAGRLELFTAYDDDPGVAGLADLGIRVRANEYGWIRALDLSDQVKVGSRVVIGSALAEDGYIDPEEYERWVIARGGPGASYLPHRRESEGTRRRLAEAGLTVVVTDLPAELVLAAAPRLESVISLPSSTAATLARVLPRGVEHRVEHVPASWWTPAADAPMREALSATVSRSNDVDR